MIKTKIHDPIYIFYTFLFNYFNPDNKYIEFSNRERDNSRAEILEPVINDVASRAFDRSRRVASFRDAKSPARMTTTHCEQDEINVVLITRLKCNVGNIHGV